MPLLFSYGTLQQPDVQLRTFGRSLSGQQDELVGFEPSVVARHANATFTGHAESRIPGIVFEITDEELASADVYEAAYAYARVATTLGSGRHAWVYVHRQHQ